MTLAPWMYIVLLGMVCLVYALLLPRQGKTAPSGDMMKELEQSMEHFASDMEEQNEALLQLFSDTKHDYEAHLAKLSGRLEQLEKQNQHLVQELTRPKPPEFAQQTSAATQEGAGGSASQHVINTQPSAAEAGAAVPIAAESKVLQLADESTSRAPLLMNVRERYADLFKLYEQKKSVEYIAKKLGMNKGEVQLIVQLARQEGKADV